MVAYLHMGVIDITSLFFFCLHNIFLNDLIYLYNILHFLIKINFIYLPKPDVITVSLYTKSSKIGTTTRFSRLDSSDTHPNLQYTFGATGGPTVIFPEAKTETTKLALHRFITKPFTSIHSS